jgi:hypothetical protein
VKKRKEMFLNIVVSGEATKKENGSNVYHLEAVTWHWLPLTSQR